MERDYQSASPEDWQVASQREAIIAPLAAKQIRSDAEIQAAADALSLKRSRLFQLMQRYLRNTCTSTLLPKRLGRRPGSLSLSKEQEAIIQRQIEEFYLKPECPNQSARHRRVALACRREQIEVPSYWAVAARVSAIDPKVKVRLRQGTNAAAKRFLRLPPCCSWASEALTRIWMGSSAE
ncbi:MAG: DNA-binding domain-containing protein [Bryobacteraceae bacterium]